VNEDAGRGIVPAGWQKGCDFAPNEFSELFWIRIVLPSGTMYYTTEWYNLLQKRRRRPDIGVMKMTRRKRLRKDCTLVYPKHALEPSDLLHFVELRGFSTVWDELYEQDADRELEALQVSIMCNPKGSPVVRGTKGLRKLRFGRADKGKSGALRVCYVYFERFFVVLLAMVYPKGLQPTLSSEQKKRINAAIGRVEAELERLHA
jgi:hypothetical protein